MFFFIILILSNTLAFEYPPYNDDFSWTSPIYLVMWIALLIITLYIAFTNNRYEKSARYFLSFSFAFSFLLNQLMQWKTPEAVINYRLIRIVIVNGAALALTILFRENFINKILMVAANGTLFSYLIVAVLNTDKKIIAYSFLGIVPVLLFFIRGRDMYNYFTFGNIYSFALLCLINCIFPLSIFKTIHMEGPLGLMYLPGKIYAFAWVILFVLLALYRRDPESIAKYFRSKKVVEEEEN